MSEDHEGMLGEGNLEDTPRGAARVHRSVGLALAVLLAACGSAPPPETTHATGTPGEATREAEGRPPPAERDVTVDGELSVGVQASLTHEEMVAEGQRRLAEAESLVAALGEGGDACRDEAARAARTDRDALRSRQADLEDAAQEPVAERWHRFGLVVTLADRVEEAVGRFGRCR